MGRKRFYDAVRDLIRDVQDEPERRRPRLSIESLLAAPVKCAACWEQIPENEKVPFSCNACLGAYCVSCLQGYGRAALRDKSILPLRCADCECRSPVPLSSVTPLLSEAEGEQLTRFQQERNAPDAAQASDAAAASAEEEKARLLGLMNDLGWRQCPDCGMGIERTQGCAHMVCVCGSEFCYSCGTRWEDGAYGCPRRCRIFGADFFDAALPPRRDTFDVMRDDVWVRIVETINELRTILRAEQVATPRPRARAVLPALPIVAIMADQYGALHMPPVEAPVVEQVADADEVRGPTQSSGKMSVGSLVHPHHI